MHDIFSDFKWKWILAVQLTEMEKVNSKFTGPKFRKNCTSPIPKKKKFKTAFDDLRKKYLAGKMNICSILLRFVILNLVCRC